MIRSTSKRSLVAVAGIAASLAIAGAAGAAPTVAATPGSTTSTAAGSAPSARGDMLRCAWSGKWVGGASAKIKLVSATFSPKSGSGKKKPASGQITLNDEKDKKVVKASVAGSWSQPCSRTLTGTWSMEGKKVGTFKAVVAKGNQKIKITHAFTCTPEKCDKPLVFNSVRGR